MSDKPLSHNAFEFQKDQVIEGRYIIGRQLGKGGMGVVFEARDTLIDEPVALKFLNPFMVRSKKGHKLFIQEAQIARRLRHENIVSVHDVSTTVEGILYLSMELLPGRSVRDLLRQHREERKFMTIRLAVAITGQVLRALNYAHKHVIHRDIKPENVMIMPGEKVKVLDFGLAKMIDETEETKEKKSTNMVGTFAYAAPEQKQRRPVDLRADIYSAGLLLKELLTLRCPVDEDVDVGEVRSDLAPSIREVLLRAMAENKEQRFQSAGDFRHALLSAYAESYQKRAAPAVAAKSGKEPSLEDMVLLEGGSFMMGNPDIVEEAPEFEAHVPPFYMDTYPVTVEAYRKFLDETGHDIPKFWDHQDYNGDMQPVIGVSWDDALAYANWAGKMLPTEAQWEFAARGRENRRYPWGKLAPETTRCNYGDYMSMPSIVIMHDQGKTPEGIYDLAGNVYEWTLNAYVPYDPSNPDKGVHQTASRRVVRGGSWHSDADSVRCSHRLGLFPETRLTTVGFRCVVPAKT